MTFYIIFDTDKKKNTDVALKHTKVTAGTPTAQLGNAPCAKAGD